LSNDQNQQRILYLSPLPSPPELAFEKAEAKKGTGAIVFGTIVAQPDSATFGTAFAHCKKRLF